MQKNDIINKYNDEEDKLLVAKILDKIKLAKTRNQIVYTDFLNMHQKVISQEILKMQKEENYIFFIPCEEAEKPVLIIYPDKYSELITENKYNYSNIAEVVRIKLPKENKEKYVHKDYLSGIMKLGIKREKIGDIFVFENGADIVVSKEISKYLLESLNQLTRFSKATIEEIDISEIRKPDIKKEIMDIRVSSLRLDNIVAELAHCSRTRANEIILEQRVFVNYINEENNSRLVKENDVVVIRGKGKFNILRIDGQTKKGKTILVVEHYI